MVRTETQAQRLMVPIGIVVAAVMVSASVIYGIDERIDRRIQEKVAPLVYRLDKMENKMDQILAETQTIRESLARVEVRVRIAERHESGQAGE